MPRPRKYIEHGALYFVTARTEEGLPFADLNSFENLFRSILARAQYLYPTHVAAFTLMANHFHMLLVPIDPEHLPLFVGYVKQELAHAVNRRQGRRQHTIWADGYDSPLLLGYDVAIHYFTYLYTQAQSAKLVDTIDDLGRASSWQMFVTGDCTENYPRVLRTNHGARSQNTDATSDESHELKLSPFVWLQRLAPDISEAQAREEIVTSVRNMEKELREKRISNKQQLRGKNTARKEAFPYRPTKFGKRTMCICWNIPRRIAFLSWIKTKSALCRAVLKKWRAGNRTVPFQPGFFPPCMPRRASTIPISAAF